MFVQKGAGASEAGGQTKEGALSKQYFQTSKIAHNRTKSPVKIVIDVFGVLAPYGNPYGSKIAIICHNMAIFSVTFSTAVIPFMLKTRTERIKTFLIHRTIDEVTFFASSRHLSRPPGLQNGYFMVKSRPNGTGWLKARPVNLERL